jgi:hypothetical protein
LARKLPPRFSVLAAECIHNLRSALDQLAWQLVIANGGKPSGLTRFPLLLKDPAGNEKMTSAYNGSVAGMSAAAKTYILGLQPYQPGNGGNDHKLRILHDLNITDKHHTLVIVKNAFTTEESVSFQPIGVGLVTAKRVTEEDGTVSIRFNRPVRPVNMERKITIQVTFAEFGRSRLVPVPHGLWELWKAAHRPLAELAAEFR